MQRRLCLIFYEYHIHKRAPPPPPYFPAASNSNPAKTTLNWSLSSSIVGACGMESFYEDGGDLAECGRDLAECERDLAECG